MSPDQLHGAMDKNHVPLAFDIDGHRIGVATHRPRLDRQIATWSVSNNIARDYWEVELEDGQRMVVYRDLNQGGAWYLED